MCRIGDFLMKNKKNKISIALFGISFLIAAMGEAYLLNLPDSDIFSIVGIGIVVILTGYLWFDSIWEHISCKIKEMQSMLEESNRQEAEKWEQKYIESLNIQKATYAALKKSIIKFEKELDQISRLQKKILEGQLNNLKADDVNEVNTKSDNKNKAEPDIIPLYDDPNTALTEDEIASLFNTYGKK